MHIIAVKIIYKMKITPNTFCNNKGFKEKTRLCFVHFAIAKIVKS